MQQQQEGTEWIDVSGAPHQTMEEALRESHRITTGGAQDFDKFWDSAIAKTCPADCDGSCAGECLLIATRALGKWDSSKSKAPDGIVRKMLTEERGRDA